MTLRQARAGDAAAIAAIVNRMIRDTPNTFTTDERDAASIAADIAARGPAFLVAEEDGRVQGFATYGPFRRGPGYAQCREHTILLADTVQRQGMGRALMAALETVARAEGVHVLVAGISSANPAAVAFHGRLGFQLVGRMPQVGCKWGRRLDLILMQKILAPQ